MTDSDTRESTDPAIPTQDMEVRNSVDGDGNPAGGYVKAIGLNISWQDGPLGRGADRKQPNGCFVETVINASISRLEFYQQSKFSCADNQEALEHLKAAVECLQRRTKRRDEQGVEGTHATHTEPQELAATHRDLMDTHERSPLTIELIEGVLTITIGADTLCDAVSCDAGIGVEVTDRETFVRDLVRELETEAEDGTTLLHVAFDRAALMAVEHGSEGSHAMTLAQARLDDLDTMRSRIQEAGE